jgi:F0F1-type ATP synthase membrane subunit c/vacuolar-type H+-ATPase subunit K
VLGIAMHNLGVGIAIGIAFAIAVEAVGKPHTRRDRDPR